ncbi:tRNA (uridine(54)-C5)-methyltransferase TrmA [Gilliamella apis]|uniref:tRNA/tmRNA (uracil-C(5))-methyltransferase n=1 Tax=Gilliamella apis TaxID=1970738 RepID=A0A2V4DP57_9GAMM|nr:tRNA (uridine(54)-C5)-methyltransferase TrmA [Gilliamella apis]PXY91717.1 tRNA (uridine(54)-C5)-methyltransferase TrmA [Gilliamella apis]WLS93279.1 tRNA (uridine(54)-C5)-methyltransferase TrmA [Gilliamella apis]
MTESFSNDKYNQQLQNKITNLKKLLSDFSLPDLQVFSSPISHYRMRAEFRIWHSGEELYHIMYDKKTKKRVRIDSFPIASQLINRAMQTILPLLQYNDKLRHQLFQIDYFSTLSGQLLITLLYHKKLDDQWIIEAERLKQQLAERGIIANLVGRASNQKIAVNVDYVDETLPIFDNNFSYRQVENSFTQPNAAINIKMLEWAISVTKDSKGDLLEFYCGNGNFSIALAQNFRKVLATEIAKASVYSAQHNIKVNNIDNLIIARLSAEEFTSAIKKERQFNRLQGINLDDYQCQTVLVDPPRAGLDDNTLEIIQSYQRIIYISCNPNTLKNNLEQLTKTHQIEHFAMFDQFPYTDHIETGIVLRKN